jgi:amino acid adenylation domain-containing protein
VAISDGKLGSFTTWRAEPNNFAVGVGVIQSAVSGRLLLVMDYDTKRISNRQAAAIRGYWLRALNDMVDLRQRDYDYRDLVLMSPAEKAMVTEQSGPRGSADGQLDIEGLVEGWARSTPGATAVVCAGRELSYGELDERAGQLAAGLAAAGVVPGDRVALCMGRSADLIVAMLAVLKAGAAYVPLDPGYPAERLEFMLRDSAALLVITDDAPPASLPQGPWASVTVRSVEELRREPVSPGGGRPADPFCTVFTSGSTGRPKAVVVTRANVSALIASLGPVAIRSDDVILQFADTSFDVANYEIWGTLCAGASLVLPLANAADPVTLASTLVANGVTVLHLTGSMLNVMAETGIEMLGGLRLLVTGSEVVHAAPVNKIAERWPSLQIHTAWGPTETTTFSVADSIGGRRHSGEILLGRPMAGMAVSIVDELGEPVPVCAPGELIVAGAGVATGYARRSAATAERFQPGRADLTEPGGRVYYSGDIGCWLPDGRIAFRGRRDGLVKVRGFRVELGEIEACAEQLAGVGYAVGVATAGQHLTAEISLFVVRHDPSSLQQVAVAAHLRHHLPHYMIPSRIEFIDSVPTTRTGKVDKDALLKAPPTSWARQEGRSPNSLVGQIIGQIWAEMLNRPAVVMEDSFLNLGGHSLIAVRIVHRISGELGVNITLSEFLSAATLEELIAAVEQRLENS